MKEFPFEILSNIVQIDFSKSLNFQEQIIELFPVMSYDTPDDDTLQNIALVIDLLPTGAEIGQINARVGATEAWSLKLYKMVLMRQGG